MSHYSPTVHVKVHRGVERFTPAGIMTADTYHSGLILVVDLEVAHGFNDGHDGLDGVAVDNGSVLLALVF